MPERNAASLPAPAAGRSIPKAQTTMNEYERQRQERIEELRARADAHRAEANGRIGRARRMMDIMQGEPIKVGHHSEGRHRRDHARVDSSFQKASEHFKTAAHLDYKANAADANTTIAAHDPEALAKLREKLDGLYERRERIKLINKEHRAGRHIDLSEDEAKDLESCVKFSSGLRPRKDGTTYAVFPGYVLTNLAGKIKQTEERLAELQRVRSGDARPDHVARGCSVVDNVDASSIEVHFPGKPGEEVRTELKAAGFRWSPRGGYWYARRSEEAWTAACALAGDAI